MKCRFGSDSMTRNISSTSLFELVLTAPNGDKSPFHSLTSLGRDSRWVRKSSASVSAINPRLLKRLVQNSRNSGRKVLKSSARPDQYQIVLEFSSMGLSL